MDEAALVYAMMAKRLLKCISSDLLAVTLLLIAVSLFAGEMIWAGKVPFFRDLYCYFYPLRFGLLEAFNAGELPLWNRHMGMGFPLLADIQTGVFYPPHFLFYVLPLFDAIRIVFVIHYYIAAVGTYLLLRRWNLPVYQAVTGALLFTMGGTMVSLVNLLDHFQSAVWLPWVILLWERLLGRASWANFVIFLAVLVSQLLAGSPEIYAMTAGLLLLQGMRVEARKGIKKFLRPCAWLGVANIVVLIISMVQLLPMWELANFSRRQGSIPFAEASLWSLNPWNLLNLVLLDKHVDMEASNSLRLFFSLHTPFFISYYLGALLVPGVALWLCHARRKETIIISVLISITMLLALGRFTPVYQFLFDYVPLFKNFRFPEKFFFLTHIFLLTATLNGIAAFCAADRQRARRGLIIFASLWIFLVVIYASLRYRPLLLWDFVIQQKSIPMPGDVTLEYTTSALVSLERQIEILFALLAIFFLSKSGYLRDSIFKVLLMLLVFLDLYSAHRDLQYLIDPEPVVNSPKVLAGPEAIPSRIFYYPEGANTHPSSFVIYTPKPTPFRHISVRVARNLLPNTGVMQGFDYLQDINALAQRSYGHFLWFINNLEPEKRSLLLGALNVKYVMSFHPLDLKGLTLARQFPDIPSWLYRVDSVAPRVYVVQHTEQEKNPMEIMKHYSTAGFNPLSTVFLEEPLPIPATKDFSVTTQIDHYEHQSVRLRVRSNGDAVLVLADSFFPGWRVYVDGKEETLLRANYFFRGVAISSGEHRVEFKYEPLPFRIGLIISTTTALLLSITTLIVLLKTRKQIAEARSRLRLAPVGVL